MKARFEERLEVTIDVPDTLRNVRIPPLILQPLVENAVKHGIAPERRGGEVRVSARLDGANLALAVEDSGAGASAERLRRGRQSGVGLANVERRLACQYGQSATLSIVSAQGEGTRVEIRMPIGQAVPVAALASGTSR